MKKRHEMLPAIWLLALLLLPATVWLLGGRQAVLENRPKVARPALSVSALQRKETFDQLDSFVRDRLPLRETALNTRGRILIDVFNVSTNPLVAIGSNGWLYFTRELDNCRPGSAANGADPADAIEALSRTLVASGRGTTVAVPPSKIVIHTSDLPSLDRELLRCEYAIERRIQSRLAKTPGGVDLMTPLLKMEASGNPPYLRSDTHWNWRGRELWARILLDGVQPGLADEVGFKTRPLAKRPGDLGLMMGVPRHDADRIIEARRAPSRPPKATDYLIVGDSQTGSALVDPSHVGTSIAKSVLPGVWVCTWAMLSQGQCDVSLINAKRAVFEIVAWDLASLTAHCWRPVTVAAKDLRGAPGAWAVAGPAGARSSSLTIPTAGTMTAHLRPASGDKTSMMRLMRIPIRPPVEPVPGGSAVTLTQKPVNGPAAPCATPGQTLDGGALFLPIPANRRASELGLELSAPPGTRLGRPEEIRLDGRPLESD